MPSVSPWPLRNESFIFSLVCHVVSERQDESRAEENLWQRDYESAGLECPGDLSWASESLGPDLPIRCTLGGKPGFAVMLFIFGFQGGSQK